MHPIGLRYDDTVQSPYNFVNIFLVPTIIVAWLVLIEFSYKKGYTFFAALIVLWGFIAFVMVWAQHEANKYK